MILFHGLNTPIEIIDLSKSVPYKDFGRGFYLTSIAEQAEKMARRTARFFGGKPIVTSFVCPDDILQDERLNTRIFNEVDETWAVFIINNRKRDFEDIASLECNADAKYDVVVGPVGDDDITLLLRQYTRGLIDSEALRNGLSYKEASDQYSFHTEKAIALLEQDGWYYVA